MTDRELLLQLLERFGLSPSPECTWRNEPATVTLVAMEGGVEGYGGFFAAFHFENDGKFRQLQIGE